jgi:hypothetical protein
MFCPQCGAPDQNSKSYCRRCGEWLSESSTKPEQRMKVMMVFNGLNSVMALLAAIILYSTYLGTPEAKWSIYVAAACCSVIAIHQAISFGFALDLRLRSWRMRKELPSTYESVNTERVGELEGRDTGHMLNLPSVTENTTEILQEAPRRSAITKPQV